MRALEHNVISNIVKKYFFPQQGLFIITHTVHFQCQIKIWPWPSTSLDRPSTSLDWPSTSLDRPSTSLDPFYPLGCCSGFCFGVRHWFQRWFIVLLILCFFKVKKKEKKKKEKQKKKKSRRAPSSSSSESSESDHRHKVATSVNKNNCIHMYSTQH